MTPPSKPSIMPDYLTVWRWHFYAGLFCIPIVLVLAITGTIYVFKPQLQELRESQFAAQQFNGSPLPIAEQVRVAMSSLPGALFDGYILPRDEFDAQKVTRLSLDIHGRAAIAFVDPITGKVIGTQFDDEAVTNIAKKIHGELLLGKRGSYLVELTACWTLVMVLTGLVLWWPRTGWRLAGVVYPRLNLKGRIFWKDLHSVIGFWGSGLIVFLIITGLPWATFWGDYFKSVRNWTGTAVVKQEWDGGHGDHAEHASQKAGKKTTTQRGGFRRAKPPKLDSYDLTQIDSILPIAFQQNLQPPAFIRPPQDGTSTWKIQSETQNRPYRTTISYDVKSSSIVSQDKFENKHWVDKLVSQGIAIHEGARFGWFNQLLAVIATGCLMLLSVSSIVMWWKRRDSGLGAPPRSKSLKLQNNVTFHRKALLVSVLVVLGILMPLFGASAIVVWLFDKVFVVWTKPRRLASAV